MALVINPNVTTLGTTTTNGTGGALIIKADTSGTTVTKVGNELTIGVSGTIPGSVESANKWSTARSVTFTGDVTGTFSIDGSANVGNVALTIGADSVALGTDTTGNYVASVANGNYITGGAAGSEGATLTLAVDATTSNTASKVVARDSNGNFSAGTITLETSLKVGARTVMGKTTATSTSNNMNPLWSFMKPVGKKLYLDEQFNDGSNSIGVYNNAGGSGVTHTRKTFNVPAGTTFADGHTQVPNNTQTVIEILHQPGAVPAPTPGYGGWYFATGTAIGKRFLCIFKMKIPSGRNVEFATNSMGDNNSNGWLTDNAGTGSYEDYAFYVNSGTANYSSTFFFYITGGPATNFYTYLASATVYELSDVGTESYRALNVNNSPVWTQSTLTNNNQLTNGSGYLTSAVTSLTGGGGISVSASNGAVTLGSNATSANTNNAIVARDGNGDISIRNLLAASVDVSGINLSSSAAISAAGTNQAGATAITKEFTLIGGGAGGGVILPSSASTASKSSTLFIYNQLSSSIKVYPPSGQQINTLGSNVAFDHPGFTTLCYVGIAANYYVLGSIARYN